MVKSSSTKFMRLLGLLISLLLLFFINACSNDAESVESGTEAGAAAYGVHIDSFTASSCEGDSCAAYAGQSIIMTASVTDSADIPVNNADVTFHFTTNASGASLKSIGGTTGQRIKVTTDKAGQAKIVYKAGDNSTTMELEDVVSATCHDSKMAVIVARVAGGYQGLIMSVTADQDSLKAGENTIIRAKVTNATGAIIGGQAVTFTMLENKSGAMLTTLGTGMTDANGEATAIYKAGSANPTKSVQDTVQAAITGAAGAAVITRVANTAIVGCRITLTADKTALDQGQSTIIRATALNGDGKPYTGNIRFEFLTNVSGSTLSPSDVKTNSNGVATTIYKAGTESQNLNVEDIIKASATQCCTGDSCCAETLCCSEAGCCMETIILTRSAQDAVTPTGYRITMTAGKTSIKAGESTLITAKVTDGANTPVKDRVVSFSFISRPSGATLSDIDAGTSGLITATGVTDASGEAIVGYTAGSGSSTTEVQDIVQASTTGALGAIILTRTAAEPAPSGRVLTLTASPSSVYPNSMSELTAKVTLTGGTSAGAGIEVTFTIEQNQSGATLGSGTLTQVTESTDGNGEAKVTYIAGNADPTLTRMDSIKASVAGTGVSDTVFITRLPTPSAGNYIITLTQDPATSAGERVQYHESRFVNIKATVTLNGVAVTEPGQYITFSISTGDGTVTPMSVELDGNGEAETTFELPIVAVPPRIDSTVVRAEFEGVSAPTYIYWAVWY